MSDAPSRPDPHGGVSVKEYLMNIINERAQKYEQRFAAMERSLVERFEAVSEIRVHLSDMQLLYARKADVDNVFAAFKEAVVKAETSTDKRFESVNEFRAQMQDMQNTLVRKAEVDIRFEALNSKVDTAFQALEQKITTALRTQDRSSGRDEGLTLGWKLLIGIAGLLSAAGVVLRIVRP